jgi:hypothetical protein
MQWLIGSLVWVFCGIVGYIQYKKLKAAMGWIEYQEKNYGGANGT